MSNEPIVFKIVKTEKGYLFTTEDERIDLSLERELTEAELYKHSIWIKEWLGEQGYQVVFKV